VFVAGLKKRYPLIPFDFPEVDTLLRNLPWKNNPITKPGAKVIEMALKQTLVAIARKDYVEAIIIVEFGNFPGFFNGVCMGHTTQLSP
jgi:hypothetical protein